MALEEVTFYNIVGEEVNLSNLVSQMIDYYDQKREVGETKLTDFNEGSEIRNLLEAYAVLAYAVLEDENEAGKLPFIELSSGTYLDRIGANPFINLSRVSGNPATGNVTFTLATAQETDYVIPAQTLLEETLNGLEYVTLSDCTIFEGETTGEVLVECLSDGQDGNVPSGTLTVISDPSIDTELVSVSNNEPLEDGTDYEDDEVYRTRLLENVRAEGFGTIGYYTNLGNSVDGVHDVKLIGDTTFTKKVLVNGNTKPTPDSVLLDVLTVFSIPKNHVMNHTFTVDRPTYTTVDLSISISVTSLLDEDLLVDTIGYLFDGVASGLADGRMELTGFSIDEVCTRDRFVNALSMVDGVVSVDSILVDDAEVTIISPDTDGVLKLGELTINQTVV